MIKTPKDFFADAIDGIVAPSLSEGDVLVWDATGGMQAVVEDAEDDSRSAAVQHIVSLWIGYRAADFAESGITHSSVYEDSNVFTTDPVRQAHEMVSEAWDAIRGHVESQKVPSA